MCRPRGRPAQDNPHEMFDSPFYNTFRRTVNWCVEHRWLTIGATVLIFALGIVGMGRVQQQFFPDSSRPEIMVDIWFPEGTSFAANEATAKRVEQRLMREEGVSSVSTWLGSGVPRFYLPLDQVFPQTNVSQMIVLPKDLKIRESLRIKLPALLAHRVSRGARPRQAAAQRAAGAVPGAVPRGRHRPAGAARARRRGQGGDARERQHCAASMTTGTNRSR